MFARGVVAYSRHMIIDGFAAPRSSRLSREVRVQAWLVPVVAVGPAMGVALVTHRLDGDPSTPACGPAERRITCR